MSGCLLRSLFAASYSTLAYLQAHTSPCCASYLTEALFGTIACGDSHLQPPSRSMHSSSSASTLRFRVFSSSSFLACPPQAPEYASSAQARAVSSACPMLHAHRLPSRLDRSTSVLLVFPVVESTFADAATRAFWSSPLLTHRPALFLLPLFAFPPSASVGYLAPPASPSRSCLPRKSSPTRSRSLCLCLCPYPSFCLYLHLGLDLDCR